MSDRSLDVLVRILTERVGNEQAQSILAEVKASAGEAGGEVEKFNVHGREMHHLLREVDRVAPGAGEALKAAFSPSLLGGAVLLGFAAEQLHEVLKKDTEIEPAKFEGLAKAIQAQRDAYEEATLAHQKYVREIVRAGVDSDSVGTFGKRMEEINKGYLSDQEKINKAAQSAATAAIEEQENEGIITHQQAIEAKFVLDQQYLQRRLALEAQMRQAEIANLQNEQAGYQAALADGTGRESSATTAAATAAGALAKHNESLAGLRENLQSSQDKQKELGGSELGEKVEEIKQIYEKSGLEGASSLQQMIEQLGNQTKFRNLHDELAVTQAYYHQNEYNEYDRQDGVQEKLREAIKQEEKKDFDLKSAANRTEEELSEIRKQNLEYEKQITELNRQIAIKKANAVAADQNARTVAGYETNEARIKAGLPPIGNPFAAPVQAPVPVDHPVNQVVQGASQQEAHFAQLAQMFLSHQKMTTQQAAEFNSTLRQLGPVQQQYGENTRQFLNNLLNIATYQDAAIAELNRKIAALRLQHVASQ